MLKGPVSNYGEGGATKRNELEQVKFYLFGKQKKKGGGGGDKFNIHRVQNLSKPCTRPYHYRHVHIKLNLHLTFEKRVELPCIELK